MEGDPDVSICCAPHCRHNRARVSWRNDASEGDGARHPFCLTGDEWPGLSNCTFDSYAQCQASASGRPLTCIANPYFGGQSDDPYAYPNRARLFAPSFDPQR